MFDQCNNITAICFYFFLTDAHGDYAFKGETLIAACIALLGFWRAVPKVAVYLQGYRSAWQIKVDAIHPNLMLLLVRNAQIVKRLSDASLYRRFAMSGTNTRTRTIFVVSTMPRYGEHVTAVLTRQCAHIAFGFLSLCQYRARFRAMFQALRVADENCKRRTALRTWLCDIGLSVFRTACSRTKTLINRIAMLGRSEIVPAGLAYQDKIVPSFGVIARFRAIAGCAVAMSKCFVAVMTTQSMELVAFSVSRLALARKRTISRVRSQRQKCTFAVLADRLEHITLLTSAPDSRWGACVSNTPINS